MNEKEKRGRGRRKKETLMKASEVKNWGCIEATEQKSLHSEELLLMINGRIVRKKEKTMKKDERKKIKNSLNHKYREIQYLHIAIYNLHSH